MPRAAFTVCAALAVEAAALPATGLLPAPVVPRACSRVILAQRWVPDAVSAPRTPSGKNCPRSPSGKDPK